ncbi:epoxide hydrolase family protein [uncultured Arthrobacter sp.]|uniref:epoxide hydrolase family protein n=1 Tax=uncultured Arthrobacter sp. TaxID=114050 RepID=UPI002600F3CE|nr:epoxide hydrolase [uncultured Arthrobacter sp.]
MPFQSIQPFTISIPEDEVADLNLRLRRTRWPDELPGVGWTFGVAKSRLQALAEYWADGFAWRDQERRLNRFPQFMTEIDGQQIHFVHVRSARPDAVPLLLTHGWPSTFADFSTMIPQLVDPGAEETQGPAFDVVIPSLPGFGFSGVTTATGWNVDRIARAWAELMQGLGYDRYIVQGGDYGSLVSPAIGRLFPDNVIGVHVNAMINGSMVDPSRREPLDGLSSDDATAIADTARQWQNRYGYAALQATRPQTLAYALNDSPVGLLAWILDLEWAVGDDLAEGETTVSDEDILTAASIYWFTQTAGSSARLYRENGELLSDPPPTTTPTAVAVFPGDRTVRSLAERHHHRIVRYTEFPRGGHFAGLQAPDLLVEDIRAFCSQLQAADPSSTVSR